MTDTIMLEAPARGGRISDLADGQGRILRLHDLTASSLGHTSHANPDRKPINVANQTESPTRTGGRVTIERKPDEGDGPAVIHRLNDERDQRWQNLIAGFLVHASRGVVRHDGQHEYTAVLCGPQAAMPFDLGTDTHTPTLGQHRDPLDHGGPYGKELCCITVPGSGIICGILQVWHDERASYKAVLGPRPYKRRPEQVIRIGQRFWQLLIPAFSDLFGEQIPDHIHLHLVIRDSEAQRTIRFIQPDGRNDREHVRTIRPTLGDATEQILQSFEPYDECIPPYRPISEMNMIQQDEKDKTMETGNKTNERSTSRPHGDSPQTRGNVMLQTGSGSKNPPKSGTIPLIPGDMTGTDIDGMIGTGPIHLGYRRILSDTEPPHQPIRYRQLAESLEGTITGGIDPHDTGKGTILSVYDLCDERDIALKDLMAGFLIEATRGFVGRTAEHEISAMLCGPQVTVLLESQSDALSPMVGNDRDAWRFCDFRPDQMQCVVKETRRPDATACRRQRCGILLCWTDQGRAYQAIIEERPYQRRPETIIHVDPVLWKRCTPHIGDLLDKKPPRLLCLTLRRYRPDDNTIIPIISDRIDHPDTAQHILERFHKLIDLQ